MARKRKVKNELIRRRRRKRLVRNLFIIIIFILSLSAILCYKLPYFNVNQITVFGYNHSSSQDIVKASSLSIGGNIFYLNLTKAKKEIKNNPYVDTVNIKRKLPSTIEITIKERRGEFYITDSNNYYIIDKKGYILDKISEEQTKNLILVNLSNTSFIIGKIATKDKKKIEILNNFSELLSANKSSITAKSIDITNTSDIKLYCGDMCIYLGENEAIETKLNKAINILLRPEYKGAKGYIDLRFNSNPAVHVDK